MSEKIDIRVRTSQSPGGTSMDVTQMSDVLRTIGLEPRESEYEDIVLITVDSHDALLKTITNIEAQKDQAGEKLFFVSFQSHKS